jgi:hypothetical protein
MKSFFERSAPLAGILSVACAAVGTLVVLNLPQEKDSDSTITSYFASHAHRVHGAIGFFASLVAVLLLLVFLTSLRQRLLKADEQPGSLAALAFGAGIASAALWATSAILGNATTFATIETSKFQVDPNTYRLLANAAYLTWVAALMIGTLVIWTTSAHALRTHAFPRWYALLGILAGASQLAAFFIFPFLAWWIWIILTSVLLVRRDAVTARTVAPAV